MKKGEDVTDLSLVIKDDELKSYHSSQIVYPQNYQLEIQVLSWYQIERREASADVKRRHEKKKEEKKKEEKRRRKR